LSRSGGEIIRRTSKTDDYETPIWATLALLEREQFQESILEPACGDGKIIEALCRFGYTDIIGSDIRTDLPEDVCGTKLRGGVDFLDPDSYKCWEASNVITNPPNKLSLPFAERALEVYTRKVAFFTRLQFLETAKRYKFLVNSPLRTVYVFSSRVTLWPRGEHPDPKEKRNNGTIAYAWFVWERFYDGLPMIEWIPPRKGE